MMQDERVNTKYKDTVFRLLFSDKGRLLSLYNALSSKRCDNIDDLKVVTLADAIYMEVKNDIAFLVGTDIHLYEHQSTRNPNMPLRFLEYIAAEYQKLIETSKKNLYSKTLIKLPQPQFVVFYNGIEDTADHEVLKLSDAFEGSAESGGSAKLELVADVYNINSGHNGAIQEACEALKGYSEFVKRTREYQRTMPLPQAVNKAVDGCIKDGILADFLRDSKAEVVGMSIFEFDREEWQRQEREESEARGAYNTKIATARNMIRMGFSAEQIAQATELPLIEVAAL